MTESKFAQRQPGIGSYSVKEKDRPEGSSQDHHSRERVAQESRKSANSWDTYRRWLTRVQAPGKGRIPLDPGLYTWKGYRNWSDKVRRDWKPED